MRPEQAQQRAHLRLMRVLCQVEQLHDLVYITTAAKSCMA